MIAFTKRNDRTRTADAVEAKFYENAHYLTPRDAVRIARCLLENVCDAKMFDYAEFESAKAVEKYVNRACDALDRLSLG